MTILRTIIELFRPAVKRRRELRQAAARRVREMYEDGGNMAVMRGLQRERNAYLSSVAEGIEMASDVQARRESAAQELAGKIDRAAIEQMNSERPRGILPCNCDWCKAERAFRSGEMPEGIGYDFLPGGKGGAA